LRSESRERPTRSPPTARFATIDASPPNWATVSAACWPTNTSASPP
jgi:hypothetical protein